MVTRRLAIALLGAPVLLLPQSKKLSADDLDKLLRNEKNLFFLDVRETKEVQELGSIRGYVNIPLNQLERRLSEVPKNKVIITA